MIEVGSKPLRSAPRVMAMDFEDEARIAQETAPVAAWKHLLLDELRQPHVRRRLALALAGVGWIHLFCFLGCQAAYDPSIGTDLRHPLLWLTELVAVLYLLRNVLGKGWIRSSSALNLIAKFWTTFLILSFNLVTLNAITGFELAWFKPVWATLSTFLFASLAWLFTPWFFIPAVQMWASGVLMVSFPEWCFLIYGVTWWIALTAIACWIYPQGK
ncbi:MAG: hypothetical protein U0790_23960 [Isosphaeraceae bacterium]